MKPLPSNLDHAFPTSKVIERASQGWDKVINFKRNHSVNLLLFGSQGFSFSNMDYGFVKQLIWLLSRRYPERLGKCLIVNAPFIFTGCWTLIRLWLVSILCQIYIVLTLCGFNNKICKIHSTLQVLML